MSKFGIDVIKKNVGGFYSIITSVKNAKSDGNISAAEIFMMVPSVGMIAVDTVNTWDSFVNEVKDLQPEELDELRAFVDDLDGQPGKDVAKLDAILTGILDFITYAFLAVNSVKKVTAVF